MKKLLDAAVLLVALSACEVIRKDEKEIKKVSHDIVDEIIDSSIDNDESDELHAESDKR